MLQFNNLHSIIFQSIFLNLFLNVFKLIDKIIFSKNYNYQIKHSIQFTNFILMKSNDYVILQAKLPALIPSFVQFHFIIKLF